MNIYSRIMLVLDRLLNEDTFNLTYINELFKLKIVKYNLRGIGTRLEQPSFNLEYGYIGHFCRSLVLSGTIYLFK